MKINPDPIGVKNLAESGRYCLFDNCALISGIPRAREGTSSKQKVRRLTLDIAESCEIRDLIYEGAEFYITEGIMGEHLAGVFYSGEDNHHSFYDSSLSKIQRVRNARALEREILIRAFDIQGKVLEFDDLESELYGSFLEDLNYLKYPPGLSYIDLDLLISGAVVGKVRNSTSIISNDYGLMNAWGGAVKQGIVNFDDVKFYLRKYQQGFQEVDPDQL